MMHGQTNIKSTYSPHFTYILKSYYEKLMRARSNFFPPFVFHFPLYISPLKPLKVARFFKILGDVSLTALFWVIIQRVVVNSYRRFGTTHRSHLQGWISGNSWLLKMWPIGCVET